MQPLDVSIFGPLTAAYRQLINNMAPHVNGDLDKVHFATLYAQAHNGILSQTVARKAFLDSGITITPDPEKVLARLPGYPAAARQTSATLSSERRPLQEIAIARSDATVNTMLDAFREESDPRQARTLKRQLLQAFEEPRATTSVLQVENRVLHAQEGQNKEIAKKVSKKPKVGVRMVFSKERMITREYAERELVA